MNFTIQVVIPNKKFLEVNAGDKYCKMYQIIITFQQCIQYGWNHPFLERVQLKNGVRFSLYDYCDTASWVLITQCFQIVRLIAINRD
jgi:hypothetical protein